jgi:hypothetical protein
MKIIVAQNRVWEMTGAQLCHILARQLGVESIRSITFDGVVIPDGHIFEVRWSDEPKELEL